MLVGVSVFVGVFVGVLVGVSEGDKPGVKVGVGVGVLVGVDDGELLFVQSFKSNVHPEIPHKIGSTSGFDGVGVLVGV